MAMNPQVTQALIGGGLSAVGAGLEAAGRSKDQQRQLQQQAQMQLLGRAPGSDPAGYARLAMQRALWEGLGPDATSMGLGGQMTVPSEMQQFVPNMGPGLDLSGAREQIMSRLSDPILAQDQARRQGIENQALGLAMDGQPQKKEGGGIGGFFKKLGKGLLKVAPIATAFIPGVGPALSMALAAGTGAAQGAVSGGGLKGALLGAGMGAAGSAAGGLLPGSLAKQAGGAVMGGGAAPMTTGVRPPPMGGLQPVLPSRSTVRY